MTQSLQMGSKFKRTIVSENVRKSLHGWRRKVRTRHGPSPTLASLEEGKDTTGNSTGRIEGSSSMAGRSLASDENGSLPTSNDDL